MVEVSIPNTLPVLLLAVYFGLSAGRHLGQGMRIFDERRKDGEDPYLKLLDKLFWKATHHYDLGILIILLASYYHPWFPAPHALVLVWSAIGAFGLGLAYDDAKHHSSTGFLTYIYSKILVLGTDAQDISQYQEAVEEGRHREHKEDHH